MKQTLLKKITRWSLAALAVVLVGASAQTALAGWNDAGSGDCPTFSIGNVTTGQGISSPCWNSTSISGKVGDTVNVKIYFHNTGNAPVTNATVSINNPGTSPVSGSQSFSGQLKVGGSTVAGGSGNISITSGPVKFRLSRVTIQRQSTNGAIETLANPQDVFTSNGISLGTVQPGWNGQGVLKVVFVLDDAGVTPPNNGQQPMVTTYSASPVSNSAGSANLRGFYDSNGYAVKTWFQYRLVGTSSWITVDQQNRGVTNGNFNYNLTGLSSGTYEFEAYAQNQYGTVQGGIQTFTITNSNTNCPSGSYWNGSACVQNPTNCPSGTYWNGSVCIQNPTNCPSGTYWNGSYCVTNVQTCGANQYWNGSYCVTNVQTCGYNQYWNGSYCVTNVQNCPSGYYLSGNQCIQQIQSSAPTVTTLGTISIGGTVAVVDGFYNANGCDAYTYFEYGTTQALGNRTNEVLKGQGTGSMAQSLSGLSQGTTYYYRAVARNCAGTNYGSVMSFSTTRTTVNDTTIVNVVNATGGAGGNSMIRLMIDNNRNTVRSGTEIAYDVTWENLTNRDLTDIVLQVNFPSQMTVIDPDRGEIERNQHSVVYQIDELNARESGEMTIVVQITGGLKEGDPVVAQAIMAFENPRTNATENAIGYDADEFRNDGSVLGASLFGLGFLPSSLGGWLIVILIILLIIILARYFMSQNQNRVVVNAAPAPTPNPGAGAPTGNDYIVYHPTKQQ